MGSRDYYKVTYRNRENTNTTFRDVLDNDTEFNANQFKLFDDFTTDLRIGFNPMRSALSHGLADFERRQEAIRKKTADPNDSGVDMENGNPHDDAVASNDSDLLENEVMVDTWSSMDSSNSPLTDSGPSASEECSPSTSSEPPQGSLALLSPPPRRIPDPEADVPTAGHSRPLPKPTDKPRARDLTLDLDPDLPRRPHFLDDDYQPPTKTNLECRIPKPHFLDHSPSPDELDERSDITNPHFLDEIIDGDDAQKKAGALPKRPQKTPQDERPRTNYRSTLHYGLESAARSSERDKRASQLYRGTWPGDRDVWTGQDSASVRSFSSNGSGPDAPRPPSNSNLENKMECVYSLLSLLTLSPDNNADLSGPLLDMSRSVESCIAMRQAGCIPLLVQLIHSKLPRETRDRAAKALRNIIHTQTDDKAGRREARVWRLLEQVREYCYTLEDVVDSRKDEKETIEDDATKHPSQSVAALMKLSFDEEHRHVVCQLGGLQALAALVSGDQAAHGSRTDDNTCLTMRKYAGMTLTNLTFGDGNNKSLLCSFKDFMMALVEQLESPNDDMRQVTAAVLRNLSWRADANSKQVLREVGAVKGLTTAAMTCQKEATLKSVLSALWNLTAHCSMNKVALCSVDGALGFLVDMLSYNSPTKTLAIVENAGGIMRNVSSHIAVREDYRQILRERNCLSVLLQHLKSPSLTVVSNSCGTLWNLSARCPLDQQFLWDQGAVPMLRSLIHSKHKMIAMGSSAALKNLLNSKPGKTHIIGLDATARSMNLPALPTLGARKQKALEQELDQNLAETCDNIEPATSPSTSNREEKNLFTATERQIAMNLERHRMTSSSPLMGTLSSQISLSHSAHLASYLSCSNTLLKGALRSSAGGSSNNVNRSDSKDSVTSAQSDTVFEKVMRTGKVPVPTPRNKDLMKPESGTEAFKAPSNPPNDGTFTRYPAQPPIPPPRNTELRTNYTESGYDVDQDSCDQPIDFSRKYSETKSAEPLAEATVTKPKPAKKISKKEGSTFGDYQETDLDQPTDYSLRYAEFQSENGSDISEPVEPSVDEDTIQHFATEGTPYETPIVFSTATSMSDLRVIGKDRPKPPNIKENPEVMTHSDEKDVCSIEDPPRPDNDKGISKPPLKPVPEKQFDTKFSSGMISPEKPIQYCDEGTPGYFSRVSSLSSLGEPTEEDCLAKKNAMATINVDPTLQEQSVSSSVKDKEGSKAVTFANTPSGGISPCTGCVEDTPLMFSRSSSLGSLPDCANQNEHIEILSEVSRITSGCISPSEIPDSPCAALSPPPRSARADTPPDLCDSPEPAGPQSVFEERATTFIVENTPAHFSTATSLSSLTIDDELKPSCQLGDSRASNEEHTSARSRRTELECSPPRTEGDAHRHVAKGAQTPGDSCLVFYTEDTPAILSKAGSNSNLSVLSITSAPNIQGDLPPRPLAADLASDLASDVTSELGSALADTSDSSNLSDAADLLEECIQKGIAKVVKNKGPEGDATNAFVPRDGPYRSLPPYLRASTETVKLSQEYARNASERPGQQCSPPPPLPPRSAAPRPPPAPPRRAAGRCHESRLPIKAVDRTREDSLSSLSLDSFGSTDREIFEETVKAGLSKMEPRHNQDRGKAHSVERPQEAARHAKHHKSLDRSDKIKPKINDVKKNRRLEHEFAGLSLTRSPYSYHGESSGSLAHHSRSRVVRDSGPTSLPARVDIPRRLQRSDSLSSLSNDSFGSTDKEVFERSVRLGMCLPTDGKLRVRSDDRLEVREHRRRRKPTSNALDKMTGDEYSRDRAILEEVIARGAGEVPSPTKNGPTPPAPRALAGGPAGRAPGGSESDPARQSGCDAAGASETRAWQSGCDVGGASETRARPSGCVAGGASETRARPSGCDAGGASVTRARPSGCDAADASETRARQSECDAGGASETRARQSGCDAGGASETRARPSGCDAGGDSESGVQQSGCDAAGASETEVQQSGCDIGGASETQTVGSADTTLESEDDMERSNECLAPDTANTTIESTRDELNRSNESYADVLNRSDIVDGWSDGDVPKDCDVATLTRKHTLEWTDIRQEKVVELNEGSMKRSTDTWNDNTCPDDVTFPTISGSVHMVASIASEVVDTGNALPDLLEKYGATYMSGDRPDLTNKLDRRSLELSYDQQIPESSKSDADKAFLDSVPEPSFTSLVEDGEPKFESIMAAEIEKEAARLAAQIKSNLSCMESSANSINSLDLDNVIPPSNLGSLLSLSVSGQWEDSNQTSKKSQKSRKKSLPVSMMVRRALSNSLHQGSSEHLDSSPMSLLDNVKPPSEMDHIDMESSMISVSSIVSEIADGKEKTPIVFDFKQPIQDFHLCSTLTSVFQDLDKVNPPSLFDEMQESTVEINQTTVNQVFEDCLSTLNVVTDIPSGSENCTPLPSDISSVESTPKKQRDSKYLTPKEKRQVAKDRYQTYTINDLVSETDVTLNVDTENFLTWTKSESDSRSDDYVTANSEAKSKRRISAKQRRLEDRARYQTQTVDIHSIMPQESSSDQNQDPSIETLRQRLASKKTMKQKRMEDAERFRTRTLSEDIPPSPTYVTRDANFENIETTTGYDSLSSNELNHQQIIDSHHDDVFSRDADSGHNDEDFELNSTQMQTYTKSFRNYLPVVESPAAIDMCIVKNLKNIEMTASYRRALQSASETKTPSSSDFASYEGDTNSDKAQSDSEPETPPSRPKPKITKPGARRDESLDSNDSNEQDDSPKAIRGRKKALYVSPYRRNVPAKLFVAIPSTSKTAPKVQSQVKSQSAKPINRTTPITTSATTSPKRIPPKSPSKIAQKPFAVPVANIKPIPLQRQGTFTMEESSVPAKDLPVPQKTTAVPTRLVKTTTKPSANTSPSRLPQLNRNARPQLRKASSNEGKPLVKKTPSRSSAPTIRTSASNHSLQSNDSGKTVTLASRTSRQSSTSSVNSIPSAKTSTKDIESKIAGLWKKVEQCKKSTTTTKPDRRVWIESEKPEHEIPKLIRSSTFEGLPKQQVPTAPKQKTSIGIRVSQIPSLKPKAQPKPSTSATRKPTTKVFARKQMNGQA